MVVVEVEVLVVQWDVDEDDARNLCLSVNRENVEVLSDFVLSIPDVFWFDLGISAFVINPFRVRSWHSVSFSVAWHT